MGPGGDGVAGLGGSDIGGCVASTTEGKASDLGDHGVRGVFCYFDIAGVSVAWDLWGGGDAVPRYSTVAMPLIVMALVTYLLYAPKILRMIVPVAIGAATLVLLGGQYGNVEKLRAFSNMERDGYRAFSEEIRRPGGTTIEELCAHFSGPLFGPGDVRSLPEFIGLMAAHEVGPFRGTHIIPGHITEWRASPLNLHASDPQYGVNWDGTRATKSAEAFGVLTLATDKPLALSAIRLTFRVKPSSLHQVDVELAWNQAAGDPLHFNHEVRWICAS